MKNTKILLVALTILITLCGTNFISYAKSDTDIQSDLDTFGKRYLDVITDKATGMKDFSVLSIVGQYGTKKGNQLGKISQLDFGKLDGESLNLPSKAVMFSTGDLDKEANWDTSGDEDVFNELNKHPNLDSEITKDAAGIEFSFEAEEGTESVELFLVYLTSEVPGSDKYLDAAVVMADGVNYGLFSNGLLLSNYNEEFLFENNTGSFKNYKYISKVQKVTALLNSESSRHTVKIAIADNNDGMVHSALLISGITGSNSVESGIIQKIEYDGKVINSEDNKSDESISDQSDKILNAIFDCNLNTNLKNNLKSFIQEILSIVNLKNLNNWELRRYINSLYDFNVDFENDIPIYEGWTPRINSTDIQFNYEKQITEQKIKNVDLVINLFEGIKRNYRFRGG